jgi:hypothetical protein
MAIAFLTRCVKYHNRVHPDPNLNHKPSFFGFLGLNCGDSETHFFWSADAHATRTHSYKYLYPISPPNRYKQAIISLNY